VITQIKELAGVVSAEAMPDGLRVIAAASDGLLAELVATVAPLGLRDLKIAEPSLETVFIELTGRELRE
jgi:ABC-2 type transport system ATP-binding protein